MPGRTRSNRLATSSAAPALWTASSSFVLPAGVTFTRTGSALAYQGASYAAGAYASVAADTPRWERTPEGAVGWLIEGAATNSLTRNSMTGAVAGAIGGVGAWPTGWSLSTNQVGLTLTINGTGTEFGLPYLDISITGTMTAGTSCSLYFGHAAASNGQSWSLRQLAKLTTGSPSFYSTIVDEDAGTGFLASAQNFYFAGSGQPQLGDVAITFANASTGSVGAVHTIVLPAINGSLNVRYRLYGPTLCLGVPPTTPILVDGATATRNAETASDTTAGTDGGFTLYLQARTAAATLGTQVLRQLDDGTANNRVTVSRNSSGHVMVDVVSGGVSQASLDLGAVADATVFKVAARVAGNNFGASLNGAAVVADTAGVVPAGMVTGRWGRDITGNHWWGHILAAQGAGSLWLSAVTSDAALRTLST